MHRLVPASPPHIDVSPADCACPGCNPPSTVQVWPAPPGYQRWHAAAAALQSSHAAHAGSTGGPAQAALLAWSGRAGLFPLVSPAVLCCAVLYCAVSWCTAGQCGRMQSGQQPQWCPVQLKCTCAPINSLDKHSARAWQWCCSLDGKLHKNHRFAPPKQVFQVHGHAAAA